MLHCWQEDPKDRPLFSQLRSTFSDMLQASSGNKYIDLQVNEDAPYYQISDDMSRHSADSQCSEGSNGSSELMTVADISEQARESLSPCEIHLNMNPSSNAEQTHFASSDKSSPFHGSQTDFPNIIYNNVW